jgi:hypothetical protein
MADTNWSSYPLTVGSEAPSPSPESGYNPYQPYSPIEGRADRLGSNLMNMRMMGTPQLPGPPRPPQSNPALGAAAGKGIQALFNKFGGQ